MWHLTLGKIQGSRRLGIMPDPFKIPHAVGKPSGEAKPVPGTEGLISAVAHNSPSNIWFALLGKIQLS